MNNSSESSTPMHRDYEISSQIRFLRTNEYGYVWNQGYETTAGKFVEAYGSVKLIQQVGL